MSTALDTFRRDFEALDRGGGPLQALRRAGWERFAARGIPTTREEAWRFTDLAPLSKQAFAHGRPSKNGIASVQTNGADASSFEIFETWSGNWGVKLVAANGEVIARGESYSSKSNATRAVNRMAEILSRNVAISE